MKRGDIYLVDLEPAQGSEADKRRPGVVVSNDEANETAFRLGRGTVTVVPLTSNTRRIYPFQVALPASRTGLTHDSKAQCEQVRSVSVARLGPRLGALAPQDRQAVDDALRIHLAL